MWLGFAAASSLAVLGLLLGSVFLARQGRPEAAKILALSAATLVHVWSSIECMVTLCGMWRVLKTWGPAQDLGCFLWFISALVISLSSIGCWATLREDDYQKFLAVSPCECSCWVTLTTQVIYFTCLPEECLWSGHALYKCVRRLRGCSDGEDSDSLREASPNLASRWSARYP